MNNYNLFYKFTLQKYLGGSLWMVIIINNVNKLFFILYFYYCKYLNWNEIHEI